MAARSRAAQPNLLDLILMPQLYRTLIAFWITMLASGGFVFLSVLATQGALAQLLPRRVFLRVSAWLQLLSFCLFLSAYFLQPVTPTVAALSAAHNQGLLRWFPAYWFLGLFQYLNGSMHGVMEPLALRAVLGLLIAGGTAIVANLLGHGRRLRRIVEEPELLPVNAAADESALRPRRFQCRLPICIADDPSKQAAPVAFGLLYGRCSSAIVLLLRTGAGRGMLSSLQQARTVFASVIVVTAWIVGVRVICSLPIALRANWVFRITQISSPKIYLVAARYSM